MPPARLSESAPFFPLAHKVIYVTRGLAAELRGKGITLAQWQRVVAADPDLALQERYRIRNPHTGKTMTIHEPGRSRIVSLPTKAPPLCYRGAHISATVGGRLPSLPLGRRLGRIVAEIGDKPPLPLWRDYVEANRYLRLDETLPDGTTQWGRAVTVAKSGGVIVYRPAAVFCYFSASPYEATAPDPALRAVAASLAKRLKGEVVTKGFP